MSNANVGHYSNSVISNSNEYFFDLDQKDIFYKGGDKLEDKEINIENFKSQSCFGPCFGNKMTIIEFEESKKSSCSIF